MTRTGLLTLGEGLPHGHHVRGRLGHLQPRHLLQLLQATLQSVQALHHVVSGAQVLALHRVLELVRVGLQLADLPEGVKGFSLDVFSYFLVYVSENSQKVFQFTDHYLFPFFVSVVLITFQFIHSLFNLGLL
jgi:hypothetical protein